MMNQKIVCVLLCLLGLSTNTFAQDNKLFWGVELFPNLSNGVVSRTPNSNTPDRVLSSITKFQTPLVSLEGNLLVGLHISPTLDLYSGIGFANSGIKTAFHSVITENCEINIIARHNYLNIPLQGKWNVSNWGNTIFFVNFGVNYKYYLYSHLKEVCNKENGTLSPPDNLPDPDFIDLSRQINIRDHIDNVIPHQLSANLGLGFQMAFIGNTQLEIEPRYEYYLRSIFKANDLHSIEYNLYDLGLMLRLWI